MPTKMVSERNPSAIAIYRSVLGQVLFGLITRCRNSSTLSIKVPIGSGSIKAGMAIYGEEKKNELRSEMRCISSQSTTDPPNSG